MCVWLDSLGLVRKLELEIESVLPDDLPVSGSGLWDSGCGIRDGGLGMRDEG